MAKRKPLQLGHIQSNDDGGQHDSGVIRAFIDSIIHNKVSPITGMEGLKSLKVILAAIESNATKKIIRV